MIGEYAYGNWELILALILLSFFFVTKYLPMRTEAEKRSGGVLLSFIVAMFTEMYGFPLTIYFLAGAFGIDVPKDHISGHLLGDVITYLGMGNGWFIVMIISTVLMILGLDLITKGWTLVHGSGDSLLTTGLYSRMRHPQYTGIYLVSVGFLIQWPTLLTLLLFPFVIRMYYNLAQQEEKEIKHRYPEYMEYMNQVPMFIPRFNRKKSGVRK